MERIYNELEADEKVMGSGMGNTVDKRQSSEEVSEESTTDSLKNGFPHGYPADVPPLNGTDSEVNVIQDECLPVVHNGTECVIDDDNDSCGDIFYDAEEADEMRLASYIPLHLDEDGDDEDDEDGDDEDEEETSSSSHELLAETLRAIREKKLLKTKQIEIRNLELLNTSWVDAATQTDKASETNGQLFDSEAGVQAEVLSNLIVQVEELLSHVSGGGQDYPSTLSSSLRLQLQNVASPALHPNVPTASSLKKKELEEFEQQPRSCDTEGSMESYDITWDINTSEWDPLRKKHSLFSPMTAESSEYSFLNDETSQQISKRKALDYKRWYCMSRPQYPSSSGISALVSCWNYLYSTLGHGSIDPLNQEIALTILGYQPPFSTMDFEAITSNYNLIKWFEKLNDHFEVAGRGGLMYKPNGRNQTDIDADHALQLLKKGIKNEYYTFIYHCERHYFCPLGYEDVPVKPTDAYSGELGSSDYETWVILGDTSSKHPGLQCKRWDDVLMDLNCSDPEFLDIRRLERGIRQRKGRRKSYDINDHCILTFQKCQSEEDEVEENSPLQEIIEISDDEGGQCLITNVRPPLAMREVDRLDKEEEELLEDDMDEDENCDNILGDKPCSVTENTLTDSDEYEESPSDDS